MGPSALCAGFHLTTLPYGPDWWSSAVMVVLTDFLSLQTYGALSELTVGFQVTFLTKAHLVQLHNWPDGQTANVLNRHTECASPQNVIMDVYRELIRLHGLVFVLRCTLNWGTLYRQVCVLLNYVRSGLQSVDYFLITITCSLVYLILCVSFTQCHNSLSDCGLKVRVWILDLWLRIGWAFVDYMWNTNTLSVQLFTSCHLGWVYCVSRILRWLRLSSIPRKSHTNAMATLITCSFITVNLLNLQVVGFSYNQSVIEILTQAFNMGFCV